jgi:hypothetical protein
VCCTLNYQLHLPEQTLAFKLAVCVPAAAGGSLRRVSRAEREMGGHPLVKSGERRNGAPVKALGTVESPAHVINDSAQWLRPMNTDTETLHHSGIKPDLAHHTRSAAAATATAAIGGG